MSKLTAVIANFIGLSFRHIYSFVQPLLSFNVLEFRSSC